MTTNQTIDGVSRKSLEQALKLAAVFDDGGDGSDAESARGVVWILRALLDAEPEGYPPCDYCGIVPAYHPWHGSGLLAGVENPHIHACNECRHLLPAGYPQGEPVAWRVTGRGGLTVTPQYPKWAVGERGLTITPLYAEPPAPVAEQLIERLAQRFHDLENMYTAEVFADWLRAELSTK